MKDRTQNLVTPNHAVQGAAQARRFDWTFDRDRAHRGAGAALAGLLVRPHSFLLCGQSKSCCHTIFHP